MTQSVHVPAYATTEPGAIVFIDEPTDGYTLEEIYTLFGPGPAVSDEGEYIIDEDALAAAAALEETPHTGAMIALVPSEDDAARIEMGGGEPVDELHLTLVYLGEVASIEPAQRTSIIDSLIASVESGLSVVQGQAFALSVFNPTGEEPCIVLGIGGADLEQYMDIAERTANTAGVDTSESKKPWIPHITLVYADVPTLQTASLAEERMGPITFDRIRVAFGDEVTDITLA